MKTAVITGGATGIGLATAKAYLAAGYHVIAAGIDYEELPEGLEFIQTDVTKAEDIKRLIERADQIDALVNCAGIIMQAREWEPDAFRKVIDVNLTAVLATSTAALEKLEKTGGSVVNIASMWCLFGAKNAPAYGASKGAIVALTRSMAAAWGERGVRVNAVAPGWVKTRLSANAQSDPERSRQISARIPMGRWCEPQEVAHVIRFLTSPEASYIHGAVIPIDGGYSIS